MNDPSMNQFDRSPLVCTRMILSLSLSISLSQTHTRTLTHGAMDTLTHTHTHMILTAMTMRGVSLTPIDREDKLRLIEANDARTTEWTHQATIVFFLFFSFSFSNRPSRPSLSALMKVKATMQQ